MSKKDLKKRMAEGEKPGKDFNSKLPEISEGESEKKPVRFFWNEVEDELFSSPGF